LAKPAESQVCDNFQLLVSKSGLAETFAPPASNLPAGSVPEGKLPIIGSIVD
jgi:hypothetical protein